MKKLHLLAYLFMALFSLSLSSCKDDEDEDISPNDDVSSNTAMITSEEWNGEGIYVDGTSIVPLLQMIGQNELADSLDISDWTFKFDQNGTFTATTDGNTETGTWQFTDNEQKLLVTRDNEETTFTIKTLTETNLNLEMNVEEMGLDPDDLMGNSEFELRFVRQ